MRSRHAKITRHIAQRIDVDTLPPAVVCICLFMVTLLGLCFILLLGVLSIARELLGMSLIGRPRHRMVTLDDWM
jgi:hypothetical protein